MAFGYLPLALFKLKIKNEKLFASVRAQLKTNNSKLITKSLPTSHSQLPPFQTIKKLRFIKVGAPLRAFNSSLKLASVRVH